MVQTVDNTNDVLNAVFGDAEERQRLAAAWESLPKNQPLPDTPEVRQMLLDMLIGMYGGTLKELEKN